MASGKRRLASDINVVPYIDVMLVLLVIFMVTAPLLTQGVKVDLPKTDASPIDTKKDEPLIVSVDKEGKFYINIGEKEKQAKPLKEIYEAVGKIVRNKPDTLVLVGGDSQVPYGEVVKLMVQLQKVGVAQLGLVTEPAELAK